MTLARACRRLFRMAINEPWRFQPYSIAPLEFWQRDGLCYAAALIAVYEPHCLPHFDSDEDIIHLLDLAIWKSGIFPLSRDEFAERSKPVLRELERIGAL